MTINLPNILTLIRLIISPLALPILLVYLLPLHTAAINLGLAIFFVLMNLTDFFDGYLARRFKQETTFGKLLDPIADKFLTFSVLVALVYIQKVYFYWAILLIGREFFVMGLRLIGLERGISIDVSSIGKLKTAALGGYITLAILNPEMSYWTKSIWNYLEIGLLALSILFSVWSASVYFKRFIYEYRRRQIGGDSFGSSL